jgi:hypothetical protein
MTGQQAFIQTNRYRLLLDHAIIQDPVFTPYSQPSPLPSLTAGSNELLLTLANMPNGQPYHPLLYLSPPLPPARTARPRNVRLLVVPEFDTDTVWDVYGPYITAFGIEPIPGNKHWAQLGIQQYDNGALSNWSQTTLTILS